MQLSLWQAVDLFFSITCCDIFKIMPVQPSIFTQQDQMMSVLKFNISTYVL